MKTDRDYWARRGGMRTPLSIEKNQNTTGITLQPLELPRALVQ
jgi:hypothetical protein